MHWYLLIQITLHMYEYYLISFKIQHYIQNVSFAICGFTELGTISTFNIIYKTDNSFGSIGCLSYMFIYKHI